MKHFTFVKTGILLKLKGEHTSNNLFMILLHNTYAKNKLNQAVEIRNEKNRLYSSFISSLLAIYLLFLNHANLYCIHCGSSLLL
jgi:hypothetical protein